MASEVPLVRIEAFSTFSREEHDTSCNIPSHPDLVRFRIGTGQANGQTSGMYKFFLDHLAESPVVSEKSGFKPSRLRNLRAMSYLFLFTLANLAKLAACNSVKVG